MDFKKIFIKDANPTKVGGQAVIEGIMMKGSDRTALCVRMPDGRMYIETEMLKPQTKWHKVPIVRGVLVFVDSLATGVRTLMKSAELLEAAGAWDEEAEPGEDAESGAEVESSEPHGAGDSHGAGDPQGVGDAQGASDSQGAGAQEACRQDRQEESGEGGFTGWLENRFGEGAAMSFALTMSVIVAILFSVGIFIVLPTWVMGLFGGLSINAVALNFIEGGFRILLFVLYITAISRMKDIQTVFRFHGAEHECIHCYESGLELTPENCQEFETLHPRCGTSFLMFVMVIALLLFSLLGWPDILPRILSRIVLIPVIAGLSYELLRWAGRSTSPVVMLLSVPGLLLQKLTTMKPDARQLEVAIAAMKAVLVPAETPTCSGYCDKDGNVLPEEADAEDEAGQSESGQSEAEGWKDAEGAGEIPESGAGAAAM
ncbi:MAG: DUF1385 domain-containing protein [Clostridiales Family XIII bacterium]|jgi:uncharacterized protein YqhQ|nr:DUF1385 domain-containing protein [Clostridiales Family XIII bacterium]